MIVLNFESDIEKLSKDEIGEFLGLDEKDIRKNKKVELVNLFLSRYDDEFSKRKVYQKYSRRFSLHPTKVEELLNITTTERKRWTKEGKLTVDHYESFNKWGRTLEYPLYDVYELSKLTLGILNSWRQEHERMVQANKKIAKKKSSVTLKRNKQIKEDFYKNDLGNLVNSWFNVNGELGATLQLSFWTLWLNRWAKEFQQRAFRAKTKSDEYNLKKESYYHLKNESLELLLRSRYTNLAYYCPPSPHKIINLQFCSHHYDSWCEERQFGYIDKWEFFQSYQKDITKCSHCTYDQIDHYYSLYFLFVESSDIPDYCFSFHIPFPIGQAFLPQKDSLNKVYHKEQEGMFRFGRTLYDHEKIIFTQKEVLKHYKKAREQFISYFPNQNKSQSKIFL